MTSVDLQAQVKALLERLVPDEVFLFGSWSRGDAGEESDIDLVVVLPIDELPETYADKMANVRKVRRALAEVNKEYALDLLVFTRPEWKLFQDKRPLFAAEILQGGRKIA